MFIVDRLREKFKEGSKYRPLGADENDIRIVKGEIKFNLFTCGVYCDTGMLWYYKTQEEAVLVEG